MRESQSKLQGLMTVVTELSGYHEPAIPARKQSSNNLENIIFDVEKTWYSRFIFWSSKVPICWIYPPPSNGGK